MDFCDQSVFHPWLKILWLRSVGRARPAISASPSQGQLRQWPAEEQPMLLPDTEDLVRRATAVYDERIRALVEPDNCGKYIAVEPESGDYFLGRTLAEASFAAHRVYPNRRTLLLRVGSSHTVNIGGFE